MKIWKTRAGGEGGGQSGRWRKRGTRGKVIKGKTLSSRGGVLRLFWDVCRKGGNGLTMLVIVSRGTERRKLGRRKLQYKEDAKERGVATREGDSRPRSVEVTSILGNWGISRSGWR